MRADHVDVMKMFSLANQNTPSMEGLMKTFQIPKLSARTTDDGSASKKDTLAPLSSGTNSTKGVNATTAVTSPLVSTNNTEHAGSTKMLMDFFSAKDKYPPYALPSCASSMPSNMGAVRSATSPKYNVPEMPNNKDFHVYKSSSSESFPSSNNFFGGKKVPIVSPSLTVSPPLFSSSVSSSFALMTGVSKTSFVHAKSDSDINQYSLIEGMRPPSAPPMSAHHTSSLSQDSFKTITEKPLDFSNSLLLKSDNHTKILEQRNAIQTVLPMRKSTPSSVQLHIVKSPAPSPSLLVTPSPLSLSNSSLCITDDELMDEALVGIGTK